MRLRLVEQNTITGKKALELVVLELAKADRAREIQLAGRNDSFTTGSANYQLQSPFGRDENPIQGRDLGVSEYRTALLIPTYDRQEPSWLISLGSQGDLSARYWQGLPVEEGEAGDIVEKLLSRKDINPMLRTPMGHVLFLADQEGGILVPRRSGYANGLITNHPELGLQEVSKNAFQVQGVSEQGGLTYEKSIVPRLERAVRGVLHSMTRPPNNPTPLADAKRYA